MDFQWTVVYFPYAEYSTCENSGSLNILVQRSGNVNISSFVTISALEQTAKEGIDFISRRVSKIQFDPGETEIFWKIVIVRDDFDEAPIEQLQVTLTHPESCLIFRHNTTIVSIYDLNRGSCSHIPSQGPRNRKISFDEDTGAFDASDDSDDCDQSTYGLLHFDQTSQNLYLCDGSKWVVWNPKSSSEDLRFKTSTLLYTTPDDTPAAFQTTAMYTVKHETYECLKGWIQFEDECYKFHRPPASHEKATEICSNYASGRLVAVKSKDHNDWLVKLTRGRPFWIGLYADSESGKWQYPSQLDVSFFNWKRSFPRYSTNHDMKNRCVIVRGSGTWINKNCESHEQSFVCSVPLENDFDLS